MQADNIKDQVVEVLDDLKALNILPLDVRDLTSITDYMVIASGTSDRHIRSMASKVAEELKKSGYKQLGVEGEAEGEWVLVDFGDVIVHIMLPQAREFYKLENLWDIDNKEEREQAE
ncbi:MAG: ribosome silencing factor [Gammaproteobacteria bacterium]|nr:ribosome silencing factor [Gammaproteobacteria bacterium]PCH62902.1 MAG: ribosome silencing factor [Gammaproteobacteria bacterium]PCH64694.1 MAG: ribosome silencing factor [Gammaproteobacteria bacterium]